MAGWLPYRLPCLAIAILLPSCGAVPANDYYQYTDKKRSWIASVRREADGVPASWTAYVASEEPALQPERVAFRRPREEASVLDLASAIDRGVALNPEVGAALARAAEARSGIDQSRSGKMPKLTARVGGGPGITGAGSTVFDRNLWGSSGSYFDPRVEAGLTGRQMIWDFGQVDSDVERSERSYESAFLLAADTALDTAYTITDAYLRVLEQRELEKINADNLAELEKLAKLIRASQSAQNATLADVRRVEQRLAEAKTAISDGEFQLATAMNDFRRLLREIPGNLVAPPEVAALLPPNVEAALPVLKSSNPSLRAREQAIAAAQADYNAMVTSGMPRIDLEVGGAAYDNGGQRTGKLDGKALLTLTHKLTDGGENASLVRQAVSRLAAERMRHRGELERLELQLRQAYLAAGMSRDKANSLVQSVAASEETRTLYTEQFKGGKRTLFELLDIQMTYVQARRSAISNAYAERNANYRILRLLGLLKPQTLEEAVAGRVSARLNAQH